jgi:hypothetical protein
VDFMPGKGARKFARHILVEENLQSCG